MQTPLALLEGSRVDHFGNLIVPIFVDLRNPWDRSPIPTLIKGCRHEHAIETRREILISKPRRFRESMGCGGNLIRDPGEAQASVTEVTYERIDDPAELTWARRRDNHINQARARMGIGGTRRTTSTVQRGHSTRRVEFGKNGWVFCASMEPSPGEDMRRWMATMDCKYDHVSHIYRPREFAHALGSMVAEQLGPQGKETPLTHSLQGGSAYETSHKAQNVFHGPVVYVDDVYALLEKADTPLLLMLSFLFVKGIKFRDQQEYRFAIWTEAEPEDEGVILQATPALLSTMSEPAPSPQVMPAVEPKEELASQ